MASIAAIYRYPIKGLSPEPLPCVSLTPGETVPGDRLYAIENGPSGFDPAAPAYLAKQHFLMLMRNERLAALRTAFDHATHTLTIAPSLSSPAGGEGNIGGPSPAGGGGLGGGEAARGDLRTSEGRAAIERFFAKFCADELRGPPKILFARGHSFSDVARKVVSIINLASVAALEDVVGARINPLRFRANLYVEGWPPWSELDLVGNILAIGRTARLKAVKRIVRCAATNVDPQIGRRDLNLPQTLMRTYGHADCGIYAEVVRAGEVAAGDKIEISAGSG